MYRYRTLQYSSKILMCRCRVCFGSVPSLVYIPSYVNIGCVYYYYFIYFMNKFISHFLFFRPPVTTDTVLWVISTFFYCTLTYVFHALDSVTLISAISFAQCLATSSFCGRETKVPFLILGNYTSKPRGWAWLVAERNLFK